jgi:glyoxylase-like metal-dependent hydrolase (beta-lactamase superfamily II)
MQTPEWLHFFQRPYPSANMVLIRSTKPILIDSGFGSDIATTEAMLREAGVPPQALTLIANTHYHGDHVGGNSKLQQRYNLPVATHRWDMAMVNSRDREACCAEWLNQPIEPYRVNVALSDGDELDAGNVTLQVIATPGHTLGHLAFYEPHEQILMCGDTFHRDDVAWLNIFREGAGVIQRMQDTLDRLARLPIRTAYSGHGPAMDNPKASLDVARRRYDKWFADPEKLAWHACKRIFTYALMLSQGMTSEEITSYLLESPWFHDYTRYTFKCEPSNFMQPLIDETLRARATAWHNGRLMPITPYTPLPTGWPQGPVRPVDWPRLP